LYRYLRQDRRRLVLAIFVYILKASPLYIIPVITRNIINAITAGGPQALQAIILNSCVLAALYLQNIPTHIWFVRLLSDSNRNLEARLRGALVSKLQQLAISAHDDLPAGKLQSKLLRDVEAIQQLVEMVFNNLLNNFVTISFAIGMTLSSAPRIALFYLFAIPVAALLIKTFRSRLTATARDFRNEVESMSARLSDMIAMIPVTRAHGVETVEIGRVQKHLDRVRRSGLRFDRLLATFGSLNWVIFGLFNLACLVLTSWLALKGSIRVGDVVMYTTFFQMILNAVMALLGAYPQLTRGIESVRSLNEVLDSPDIELNSGKQRLSEIRGTFKFESISFAYAEAARAAIEDFSLEVRPGESVAFVGESGSGKSTLMNLLIGFRRPTAGRILLDGHPMDEIDLRTFRHSLAVVSQNTVLFSGTIRENITYGQEKVDDTRVLDALRMANALEFVQALPKGINTAIGEHGGKLSGGQRQRLAIARALLRDPRVLILDEATSALDAAAERQVQEALERLMHGRTTFIVAHRLSTVRKADRIIVMQQGRMIECGSYDALVAQGGEFSRLVSLQQG
jgi:ATP-binding cassette subfamily B protein